MLDPERVAVFSCVSEVEDADAVSLVEPGVSGRLVSEP